MSREVVGLFAALRETGWDKEGWFLPLAPAIDGISAAVATWQPPGGGNSIWQTVNHVNYYNERYLARVTGAPLGPALPDNDATFADPGNPEDEAGWQATVAKAREIADGWRKVLAELTDADLARKFLDSTLGDTLQAWIMHDTYHTGQIVLLRKMQGAFPAKRG